MSQNKRISRGIISGILAFAFILNAVLPFAVSHAQLPQDNFIGNIEICTADGGKTISADAYNKLLADLNGKLEKSSYVKKSSDNLFALPQAITYELESPVVICEIYHAQIYLFNEIIYNSILPRAPPQSLRLIG
ncbi:MAG: hypothetical protein COV36_02735 [Alphaproteobacteria bacterium CG11_big_fil_rev_8_21_14_0_20_44_7]|nr:MAG: hypothetical protein COV36_02735 [Alphaproteobacteria bacterium CG11_big_fil_rev_8_21_14_0_20_44_7]